MPTKDQAYTKKQNGGHCRQMQRRKDQDRCTNEGKVNKTMKERT